MSKTLWRQKILERLKQVEKQRPAKVKILQSRPWFPPFPSNWPRPRRHQSHGVYVLLALYSAAILHKITTIDLGICLIVCLTLSIIYSTKRALDISVREHQNPASSGAPPEKSTPASR
jgi:hypothetical protein